MQDKISPDHYKQTSLDPITIISVFKLGFHLGNVVKYILRHEHKNGVEDLAKAQWYLNYYINSKLGSKPITSVNRLCELDAKKLIYKGSQYVLSITKIPGGDQFSSLDLVPDPELDKYDPLAENHITIVGVLMVERELELFSFWELEP